MLQTTAVKSSSLDTKSLTQHERAKIIMYCFGNGAGIAVKVWCMRDKAGVNSCVKLALPVRTEVNGCQGSKGHFNLPDSTVPDSSWNTPS